MVADLTHGFQFGAFKAEPLKGCVIGDDRQPRHLPPKAMEVLTSLAEAAPEPLTREDLINKVWGERCVSDEVLTHAIAELRHVLGDRPSSPEYIQTIPKRGYRLLCYVRPTVISAPPQEKDDRGSPAQSRVVWGFDAIQRNPVASVLFLGGFAGALSALYYLHDDQENESLVPVLSPPRVGQTLEHTPASELMLQAESLERRTTPENARNAEILLEKAVSIEPDNAPAWSLLGRIYYRQTRLFRSRPLHEGMELARQAMQRALVINPNYGPAHADLALVNMTFDFDFDGAFQHLRRAQDLNPADPHVLRVAAKMEMTHAHVDHAIDLLERSVGIDPHSCILRAELGQAYYFASRLGEAEKELDRSLILNPDVVRSRYLLGLVRLARHSEELALAAMRDEPDEGFRLAGVALVRHAMANDNASNEALSMAITSEIGPRAYPVAAAYAFRGQHEDALDWLELAYDKQDGDVIFLLVDPLLAGLRSTDRWQPLVEKLGLPHRM